MKKEIDGAWNEIISRIPKEPHLGHDLNKPCERTVELKWRKMRKKTKERKTRLVHEPCIHPVLTKNTWKFRLVHTTQYLAVCTNRVRVYGLYDLMPLSFASNPCVGNEANDSNQPMPNRCAPNIKSQILSTTMPNLRPTAQLRKCHKWIFSCLPSILWCGRLLRML